MTLEGVDISHWQPTTPSLAGLSFAFAKASEGLAPDSLYATHLAKFRKAGIVTGAYHFARADVATPEEQARYFVTKAGDADLYALDVENTTKKDANGHKVPVRKYNLTETQRFIAEMHRLGKACGLYMSRSVFYVTAGQDWNWVADYRGITPTIKWAFWQYTSTPIDHNHFNGTLDELHKLAGRTDLPLIANSPAPVHSLVDVKKGGQVYTLAGAPLIRWSNDYTVTSLGQSGKYEVIVVTTGGITQYALTDNVSNRRTVGTPIPTPIPPPPVPTFATAPQHVAAKQPGIQTGMWTAAWEPDTSAWIATGVNGTPVCLLVHGGPIADDSLGGVDNLAGQLAVNGAKGIALRYPTMGTTFAKAMAPLRAAVTKYKPDIIVAHSLGGYFGSILSYETGLPLVMVATDVPSDEFYRIPLGGPLASDEMKKAKNRVTVVTGSADFVATVAENQALVADLAASGHPGKWIILDGADHNSILSDVGTLAAILG